MLLVRRGRWHPIPFAAGIVDTGDGPTIEIQSLHLVVGHSRQIAVNICGRSDPDEQLGVIADTDSFDPDVDGIESPNRRTMKAPR